MHTCPVDPDGDWSQSPGDDAVSRRGFPKRGGGVPAVVWSVGMGIPESWCHHCAVTRNSTRNDGYCICTQVHKSQTRQDSAQRFGGKLRYVCKCVFYVISVMI